jgi:DNA-binding transcriptional MerR regulator
MQEPHWTLDELAERVETALAVDYHGQASGRVRAVPDRRAIRWYTTIGLIDRPVAHRGRTALYGPRHLLQLVAVKRLQARGLPLVSIQQELAGATDTQLARVARLPGSVAAEVVHGPEAAARGGDGLAGMGPGDPGTAAAARSDTPVEPPAAAARPEALAPPPATAAEPPGAAARPATARPPAAAARSAGVAPRPAAGKAGRARFWREQPAAFIADPTDPRLDPAGTAGAATLRGVRLGDGATLLLEPGRELGREDVQAILDAARPLLATLRDRGLGAGARSPGKGPEARPAGGTEPRREHP